ncbi:hypothetical protein BN134_3164 [Cronobacter dublinensis 1210]|uniref:Uncharacterized protein n=1 Tax=Cronobacter dublinensis 1210 TaxID=1208656 RepID=A0ABM9QA00_9ENTR|nr:hypothetical protein BN134_3164 [Cronobacter dublinensis 1210]
MVAPRDVHNARGGPVHSGATAVTERPPQRIKPHRFKFVRTRRFARGEIHRRLRQRKENLIAKRAELR